MKIKITEIEATAEELRQSNTLADGLTNMLRRLFNQSDGIVDDQEGEADKNEED